VRFAVAVIGGALVQLVPYMRQDTPAILAIAYIVFAALGVGFFAARRAWLAGALSVLGGAALYGIVSQVAYRGAATIGDFFTAETSLLLGIAPYTFFGALAGLGGGWLRARAVGTRT
jgi:hypothetical protein